MAKLLDPEDLEPLARRVDELRGAGVPEDLAARIAGLPHMYAALDVVEVADDSGLDVQAVAAVHFRLGSGLGLHWVHDRIVQLPREDRWQAMARAALRDDLYSIHRELTAQLLRSGPRLESPDARVHGWIDAHRNSGRCLQTLADIAAGRTFDITTLSVAVREVRGAARGRASERRLRNQTATAASACARPTFRLPHLQSTAKSRSRSK